MPFVYVNGRVVPEAEALIPVRDGSYLFGEGVFETLRAYSGNIPLLPRHLERLEWSATFLGLAFPSDTDFKKILGELLEQNNLRDARCKIVLSAVAADPSSEGRGETRDNIVVFCDPLDVSAEPCSLHVARGLVADAKPLAAVKTTNRLVKLLAYKAARDAGCDDALLFNAGGLVTEATTANVFWVDSAGRLMTVSESHGLLRGVMRQEVMAMVKEHDLACGEAGVTPEELSSAREVFLTNALYGIKPVIRIDRRKISGGRTGDVTLMLQELWEKRLKTLLEKARA